MNHIKKLLPIEISSKRGPNSFGSICRVFIRNFDGFATTSGRSRIGKQLGVAAFLQRNKPKDRFLDRLSDCKETVVLKKRRFLTAQRRCDVQTFFLCENDSLKLAIECEVLQPEGKIKRLISGTKLT